MRTKTLLIAAAALVVGVISSQAQVYSQNVVGYYNVTIPAGQFYILANQLVNGTDTAQTNNDINAVYNAGFSSDPNGPHTGSQCAECLIWTGSSFTPYYFMNETDNQNYNGVPAGWVDSLGNPIPNGTVFVNQGEGTFIYNPTATAFTNTIVGTVLQGTNIVQAIAANAWSMLALAQPIATNADSSTLGIGISGLSSDPNGPHTGSQCAEMLVWAGASGGSFTPYYYMNETDNQNYNSVPAGWVDSLGNPITINLNVGQGFFLYQYGSSINYTNAFTVQ
jgi:hypothetical protein